MYAYEKHSYLAILWANITSSWTNMLRQNKLYIIKGTCVQLHTGQTLYNINIFHLQYIVSFIYDNLHL